jgi:hypothetical protein
MASSHQGTGKRAKTKAGHRFTSGGTTIKLKGKQPKRGNKGKNN